MLIATTILALSCLVAIRAHVFTKEEANMILFIHNRIRHAAGNPPLRWVTPKDSVWSFFNDSMSQDEAKRQKVMNMRHSLADMRFDENLASGFIQDYPPFIAIASAIEGWVNEEPRDKNHLGALLTRSSKLMTCGLKVQAGHSHGTGYTLVCRYYPYGKWVDRSKWDWELGSWRKSGRVTYSDFPEILAHNGIGAYKSGSMRQASSKYSKKSYAKGGYYYSRSGLGPMSFEDAESFVDGKSKVKSPKQTIGAGETSNSGQGDEKSTKAEPTDVESDSDTSEVAEHVVNASSPGGKKSAKVSSLMLTSGVRETPPKRKCNCRKRK